MATKEKEDCIVFKPLVDYSSDEEYESAEEGKQILLFLEITIDSNFLSDIPKVE